MRVFEKLHLYAVETVVLIVFLIGAARFVLHEWDALIAQRRSRRHRRVV